MMGLLRWGIFGGGRISNDFSIAFTNLSPQEHKLVGVATRSIETAEKFAQDHNIEKAYGSYEQLAKDSSIDVIYIGTTHLNHLELGKLALENGKHVLCEKPLCMNLKETKELVEYAKEKNLFLMEGIWSRFFPVYYKLREELAAKSIGEIKQVIVTFGIDLSFVDNIFESKSGGGCSLAIGMYCLQFASLVYGGEKPVKIVASGHLSSGSADESASATLIYENGKTATLISHLKLNFQCEATAIGTNGTIKIEHPFWSPETLKTPSGEFHSELPKCEGKFNFSNSQGLSYQCGEVRRCIQNGLIESPLLTHAEILLLAEMNEDIRKQVGVIYPQDIVWFGSSQ